MSKNHAPRNLDGEPTMPERTNISLLTNEALLAHLELASNWEENAFTTRQAKSWAQRAKVCREEILKRMDRC